MLEAATGGIRHARTAAHLTLPPAVVRRLDNERKLRRTAELVYLAHVGVQKLTQHAGAVAPMVVDGVVKFVSKIRVLPVVSAEIHLVVNNLFA